MLGFRKNGFSRWGAMAIARPPLREFFGMRVKEAQPSFHCERLACTARAFVRAWHCFRLLVFQAFLSLKPDGVTSSALATAVCEQPMEADFRLTWGLAGVLYPISRVAVLRARNCEVKI